MSGITYIARLEATKFAPALSLEPAVRPDFGDAGPGEILAIILAYVGRKPRTSATINAYLEERGCRLGGATIQFLLDLYEGDHPRHHLWERDVEGRYQLLA